jgi:hypothetical protein
LFITCYKYFGAPISVRQGKTLRWEPISFPLGQRN